MISELDNELLDFKERKLYSRYLCESYFRLYSRGFCGSFDFGKKYNSVSSCASFLDFAYTDSDSYKLHSANFCRDLLCPMCAWRRSKKLYGQVYSCVDYMKNNFSFVMLTLTVRNVSASSLSDSISHLNCSFAKLVNYKAFKRICKGYLKCLEVTYNRHRDDYHPHFHVLIAVDKCYFKSKFYLSRSKLLSMWRRATKDPTITQVDIRRIYGNFNRPELDALASAVAEVAKYAVKPSDYIFTDNNFLTDRVTYTLSCCLYGRRLFSFGGCFSDARKEIFKKEKEENNVIMIYRYHLLNGKYVLYAINDAPLIDCETCDKEVIL